MTQSWTDDLKAFIAPKNPAAPVTWQSRLAKPTFRGIPFYCNETSNSFGRRIAMHEYPQHDVPYAEDMGRKARSFNLDCYVIGEEWEKWRDKLILACEQKGPGKLVHPDLGEWNVVCESCTVIESKVNSARMATFQITFLETGINKSPYEKPNSAARVKTLAPKSIFNLANAFAALYKLTQLPQLAVDYVMDKFGDLTGISNPYALLNAADSIRNILNGDIRMPWQVSALTTAWTASYNLDYSDSGTRLVVIIPTVSADTLTNYTTPSTKTTLAILPATSDIQTNRITSSDAVKIYLKICNVPLVHCAKTTPSQIQQWEAGKRVELFVKSCAIIECVTAIANTPFGNTSSSGSIQSNALASLQDAQRIWTDVLGVFDNLIGICDELNDNQSFIELRTIRAAFHLDIQTRAPELANLIYRNYLDPIPSLVIAYDVYEDLDREVEILARNHIRHPGFIATSRLELLSE